MVEPLSVVTFIPDCIHLKNVRGKPMLSFPIWMKMDLFGLLQGMISETGRLAMTTHIKTVLRGDSFKCQFLARKCWGTKTNFILHDNAIYRNPRSDWLHLDTNLTVILKNGKIREIVVDDEGANYYATEVIVEGTGAGVDAVPVFDEYGLNTKIIFDDPRIKNLEFDHLERPSGAGQGFRERPWSGDELAKNHYSLSAGSSVGSHPNDPVWGYDERIDSIAIYSDQSLTWKFGQPVVADYLGDRISKVEVLDPGLYSSLTDLSVSIDYESNGSLDFDFDGVPDFISAQVTDHNASRLTRFILDDNGSYDENISGTIIERGLFNEVPTVQNSAQG